MTFTPWAVSSAATRLASSGVITGRTLLPDRATMSASALRGRGQAGFRAVEGHIRTRSVNSRKHVAENLAGVPDDEAHQIVELNARKLLRFNG